MFASGSVSDDIIGLLESLWRDRGLTLVIVTHDSAVAARALRMGQMRDGRLLVNGTAAASGDEQP
jgi:putative ABC transport system ATP-binding protein